MVARLIASISRWEEDATNKAYGWTDNANQNGGFGGFRHRLVWSVLDKDLCSQINLSCKQTNVLPDKGFERIENYHCGQLDTLQFQSIERATMIFW